MAELIIGAHRIVRGPVCRQEGGYCVHLDVYDAAEPAGGARKRHTIAVAFDGDEGRFAAEIERKLAKLKDAGAETAAARVDAALAALAARKGK